MLNLAAPSTVQTSLQAYSQPESGGQLAGPGRAWRVVGRSVSYFMQIGGVRFCGFCGI